MSLWLPSRKLRHWFAFGLLAMVGLQAFMLGAVSGSGMFWLGLLLAAGSNYHHGHVRSRRVARTLFLGLILALGFGLLPGFDKVVLLGAQTLKSGSAAYTLQLRLDKVIAGFALLAFVLPLSRDRNAWRRILAVSSVAVGVTASLVLVVGWLSGYVDFLPQLPSMTFLLAWMGSNLLFVTGVEEGFFRGVVQRSLLPYVGTTAAIGIGALLFGLAHFGGGVIYMALATLAGAGYGTAYHLSGQRIEAAMLTHFGVNLLHLLLFTYPYTAGA